MSLSLISQGRGAVFDPFCMFDDNDYKAEVANTLNGYTTKGRVHRYGSGIPRP
jgi:hypothetical protein